MTTLGTLADTHQPRDDEGTYNGPQDQITTDIQSMVDSYGASDIYILGDKVHPYDRNQGRQPHVKPEAFDAFWKYVDNSGYGDRVAASIPAHHSAPIQKSIEARPEQEIWSPVEFQYDDGLRVLCIRTSGSSTYTGGGPDETKTSGVGEIFGHVPFAHLKWLDERLQAATDAGDAALVLTHKPLYPFGEGDTDGSSVTNAYSPKDQYVSVTNPSGTNYPDIKTTLPNWIVRNYHDCHKILSQYSNVVVLTGHEIAGNRASRTVDGVTYCHPAHYYSPSNDSMRGDYCIVDGDSSSISITYVYHDGSTGTLVDRSI